MTVFKKNSMKKLFFIAILILSALIYLFQNNDPEILWENTLNSRISEPKDIIESNDGGYIVIGEGFSSFSPIVKLDQKGKLIWEKDNLYIGSLNSIHKTNDGNYITAGRSYNNPPDFAITKLNPDFDTIWTKTYGGPNSEEALFIEETKDGNYIVAGNKDINEFSMNGTNDNWDRDFWVLKLDQNGGLVWSKTYGGSGVETLHQLVRNVNGNYTLKGSSESKDGDLSNSSLNGAILSKRDSFMISSGMMPPDDWNVEIDANGKIINTKNRRGSRLDDNDYYLHNNKHNDRISLSNEWLGNAKEGSVDAIVKKYGVNSWEKTIGDSNNSEKAMVIRQTSDGGYVLVGTSTRLKRRFTDSDYSLPKLWIVKLASDK